MSSKDSDQDARILASEVTLAFTLGSSIVSLLISLLMWNMLPSGVEGNSIAYSLTVLEIVLAVFAFILGVAAVFGFWTIREAAMGAARQAAEDEVKRLQDRGLLYKDRPKTDHVPDIEPRQAPDTSDVVKPEGEEWEDADFDKPEA